MALKNNLLLNVKPTGEKFGSGHDVILILRDFTVGKEISLHFYHVDNLTIDFGDANRTRITLS